jgi:AraC-like DNA-binding protein
LDESDILRPLVGCVRAVERLAVGQAYLGLPRAGIRLLIRQWPGSREVDVHAIGPRAVVVRKPALPHRAVAIELAAGAACDLLDVSAHELAGRAVSLRALWGRSADAMFDELAGTPESRRAAVVLAALAARARGHSRDRLPALQYAARVLDGDPSTRVRDLAAQIGISERQLRRWFEDGIGITPKAYARITRLRRAVASSRATPEAPWATIALDAGYYDQAHMIGEFRSSTGCTPRELVAEIQLLDS